MSKYTYRMVQIPPTLTVRSAKGGEAAAYLQSVVNTMAAEGWEFWRVDSIGVAEQPGCLAALLGVRASTAVFHVVTFRRSGEAV